MKPIPGYPKYHIDETGRVFREMTVSLKDGKYPWVWLSLKGKRTPMSITTLMARTYLGMVQRNPGRAVEFLDGDCSNMSLSNLRLRQPNALLRLFLRHEAVLQEFVRRKTSRTAPDVF